MKAKYENSLLEGSVVYSMLSELGKRAFFPQGIVAQSREAMEKATFADATAGIAANDGSYLTYSMFTESIPFLTANEIVGYAPTAGIPLLREKWQQEIIRKNKKLKDVKFSLPVVTVGITHSIALAASLFVDANDEVVILSPAWDNYHLIFEIDRKAKIKNANFFDEELKFSLNNLKKVLKESDKEKIILLLNFPHNPTGYTPNQNEMEELTSLLVSFAKEGKKLVVISDDAYFGLFHTKECSKDSLFAYLADAHENILAIKCDGATKEALSWGLRLGFISFGAKLLTSDNYHAMVQKTMGLIRSTVSSSSQIGQSLLLKALADKRYQQESEGVASEMKKRFNALLSQVEKEERGYLELLPCNSGYFCSFVTKGDAFQLRETLLEEQKIGCVAIDEHLLRVAYSQLSTDKIEPMVKKMFECAKKLWK